MSLSVRSVSPRILPPNAVIAAPDDLAERLAAWLVEQCRQTPGVVRIALCGGRTPRAVYQLLATPAWRTRMPWPRLELYLGDERCVPRDDPRSNLAMLRDTLLRHVPLAPAQVQAPEWQPPAVPELADTGAAARFAAQLYHLRLARLAQQPQPARSAAWFDVMLLGLGADGHTASLFPNDPAALNSPDWAVATQAPQGDWRVSLSLDALQASRKIAFFVTGADKTPALHKLLGRQAEVSHTAAARLITRHDVVWFLDHAALGLIPPRVDRLQPLA